MASVDARLLKMRASEPGTADARPRYRSGGSESRRGQSTAGMAYPPGEGREWLTNGGEGRRLVQDSDAVRALSNRELIAEITATVARLARAELELAKAEIRADVQAELATVKLAALAALAVLLGVNMLLVAGVLALATSIPGWMAALVVGGVLLAGGVVAGYIGWRHMVTNPLALTRQTVREDARWVKERLA